MLACRVPAAVCTLRSILALPPLEPRRTMDSEHALCRECKNVVRVDWERCFHCGVSVPVAGKVRTSLLRSGVTIAGLVVLAVAAMNASTLWEAAREAPKLVAREASVPQIAPQVVPHVAPRTAPRIALPASASGPAAVYGAVRATGGASPATAIHTSSVSAGDVARSSSERAEGAAAVARLDQESTARAIANCKTLAAIDSLESRLRSAYPADPSLALGGRTWRLIKARRAALTLG